jgi:hypothetical protein
MSDMSGSITVNLDARGYAALLYGLLGGAPVVEPPVTPELAAWEDEGGALVREWTHTFTA